MTIPQISDGSQESFYDQPEPCTIGVSKHSARGNIMKAFPTFWWSERRSCRSCTPKWSCSTSGSLRVHFSITFNYFVSNVPHFLRGTIFFTTGKHRLQTLQKQPGGETNFPTPSLRRGDGGPTRFDIRLRESLLKPQARGPGTATPTTWVRRCKCHLWPRLTVM